MSTSPKLIGYLAPDGTHYPCEAWEHRKLALRIVGQRPPSLSDVRDDGATPPDAEQLLDRAGYVRIEKTDRDDPGALSWAARYYNPGAMLTDAQRTWLRVHGYGRLIRELLTMMDAYSVEAPESPDELAMRNNEGR